MHRLKHRIVKNWKTSHRQNIASLRKSRHRPPLEYLALCSRFILNARWRLWWSHLMAGEEKVNLIFISRERSSIFQTRMVKGVSQLDWEKMYPVWLVAVRAFLGVEAMLVSSDIRVIWCHSFTVCVYKMFHLCKSQAMGTEQQKYIYSSRTAETWRHQQLGQLED